MLAEGRVLSHLLLLNLCSGLAHAVGNFLENFQIVMMQLPTRAVSPAIQ